MHRILTLTPQVRTYKHKLTIHTYEMGPTPLPMPLGGCSGLLQDTDTGTLSQKPQWKAASTTTIQVAETQEVMDCGKGYILCASQHFALCG